MEAREKECWVLQPGMQVNIHASVVFDTGTYIAIRIILLLSHFMP